MGTANRGNKPSAGGGTAFVDGTSAEAAEVNTDFDNIYNEFNGNIEDVNLDAAADIDPSKVGDYSATDAEQRTASTPGDTETPVAPTTMEGELEKLRYQIELANLGVARQRVNAGGTTVASWLEPGSHGPNLLFNAHGNIRDPGAAITARILGWENFGTVTAADAPGDPRGRAVGIGILATANNSGVQQLVRGLKPSTKYLLTALVDTQNGAQVIGINTTGADVTSGYRDIDVTSTGLTTDRVIAGIFQTDAAATPVLVQLEAVSGHAAGADEFRFNATGLYELAAEHTQPTINCVITKDRITATQALTAAFANVAGLSSEVLSFSPQSLIRVHCQISILFSGAGRAYARLNFQDIIGATGTISTDPFGVTGTGAGDVQTIDIFWELVPDGDTATGYNVQPQVIASGAVGTVNGVADTLTLASTLWVEQVNPG